MPFSPEVQERQSALQRELQQSIEHSAWRAGLNHWTTIILMILALLASVIAGVGGIFFGLDSKATGGLALIPGFLTLAAATMRFQEKAQWHYRLKYGIEEVRRRLLFELPASATLEDVQSLSQDWSALIQEAQHDWPALNFNLISARTTAKASEERGAVRRTSSSAMKRRS